MGVVFRRKGAAEAERTHHKSCESGDSADLRAEKRSHDIGTAKGRAQGIKRSSRKQDVRGRGGANGRRAFHAGGKGLVEAIGKRSKSGYENQRTLEREVNKERVRLKKRGIEAKKPRRSGGSGGRFGRKKGITVMLRE